MIEDKELWEAIATSLVDARVGLDLLEDTILKIAKTLHTQLEDGEVKDALRFLDGIIRALEPDEEPSEEFRK